MQTKLTRRSALKGIAATASLPLISRIAFAGSGEPRNIGPASFDEGWLFLRGDAANAQDMRFDDSAWRKVDLPHDWSIEDLHCVFRDEWQRRHMGRLQLS